MTVESPASENEGLIPIEYTGYGADISPALKCCDLTKFS